MYEIDNRKFGAFLAQLRKGKGWTQKELAAQLFLSDKAVSKWERGLSMPDIALLTPLAELLDVTVTELLQGERLGASVERQDVEALVAGTLALSEQEFRGAARRRRWGMVYFACVAVAALEVLLLLELGFAMETLAEGIFWVEGICLLFGGWLCLFVKETLPNYYDENKISSYSDGFFRMNLAGIRFSNRNWPYILRVGRGWTLAAAVLFPPLYWAIQRLLSPAAWDTGRLTLTLVACLGLFVPMIVTAKRHE